MTPASDPQFYDGVSVDPATWPGQGFDLYLGTEWLAALPPTVGFTGDLGPEDPYTYSRPPGGTDAEWFRRGTGQQRTRPLLTLGGTWTYQDAAEAVAHTAQIESALLIADRLTLQGQPVTTLRTDFPQICRTRNGARYIDVTYTLTLQPTGHVTRTDLQLNTGTLPLPVTTLRELPYIWPEAGDPETYASPVTVDLAAPLDGKPVQRGVIENLGSAPFEVVLITAAGEQPALTVLPQTSRDLMPGLTAVRIIPAAGEDAAPQLEVQA